MRPAFASNVSLIVFAAMLSLQPWTTWVQAQVPNALSDPGVPELMRQLEELQHEVRYLRRQQESVIDSLPGAAIHREVAAPRLTPIGYQISDSDANCRSTSGQPCRQPCRSQCNCYHCQRPLPESPCIECPRVSTVNPYFNVQIFGALKLDMLYNSRRTVSPGTPFFLLPAPIAGFDEQTFDLHARQSMLAAALTGPQFGGFQSGGLIAATFYNDAIVVDQYGFLPLQAYGELQNETWRFAAGLQFDIFNPGTPTVLPFSVLGGSGNAGNAFRGQVRLERFIKPSDDVQWTVQVGISEPISSTIDPQFRLIEDNGWPNVEGRIALGLGAFEGAGLAAQRPFEWGVSAVGGQLRDTTPLEQQVVTDVWGVGTDLRWKFTERFGMAGEFYTGQALGTYNAGVLQNLNTVTREGIRSTGGWLELFAYITPCLHSHCGYAVDDPLDRDVAANGRLRNETYFANLLWDLNATFRLGFEFTYRETTYQDLPDNEGPGLHTQFQWSF